MSTAVEVLDRQLADLSLTELGALANREHRAVIGNGQSMLEHALKAGEALSIARSRVAPGEWSSWCAANFLAHTGTASSYMRLWFYRDEVGSTTSSIATALKMVKGLPRLDGGRAVVTPDEAAEIQRLHEEGLGYVEIGKRFDISPTTAHKWGNPKNQASHRANAKRMYIRRQAAERALVLEERKKAAARIGGPLADAYSLARKTAQRLDQAHDASEDREVREALSAALRRIHSAEDEIVKALGIS